MEKALHPLCQLSNFLWKYAAIIFVFNPFTSLETVGLGLPLVSVLSILKDKPSLMFSTMFTTVGPIYVFMVINAVYIDLW